MKTTKENKSIAEFNSFYSEHPPLNFAVINDDNSVRCAVRGRKTVELFLTALSDALSSELDYDVSVTIDSFDIRNYRAEITAEWENEEGDEEAESFTIQSIGLY